MATALEYIHALAEENAEFGTFTTDSGGSTTTLVCSSLVNSVLSVTEFSGMYVLIESGTCAGQVGSIKSFARSTGTLTVGDAFTATIATSVAFSLYRLFPPLRDTVVPGWLQIVNMALRRLWVPDRISFTGVTAQKHYSIDTSTYPWWTDDSRIMWIERPVTNSDDVPVRMNDNAWLWLADAETRKLVFPGGSPANTGETFTVRLYRPANSRLKVASSWADQTTQTAGLTSITDEAISDVADVVTMGTALLYRTLSRMKAPSADVVEWLQKARPSIAAARELQQVGLPRDRNEGIPKLRPTAVNSGRRSAWWDRGY